jgi:uncharacterized integral membrane protein (TIGR00698 family)
MAMAVSRLTNNNPIFSPLIIAALLGMVVSNLVKLPTSVEPGAKFAGRTLLRLAIVLLGAQLTIYDLMAIGPLSIVLLLLLVVSTFFATLAAGRALGVEERLAQLIGMGTAVCGASAIVAAGSATSADNEDVAYALICITFFGTVAMLAIPIVATLVGLDAGAMVIWAGASIQEIAQVAGATATAGAAHHQTGMVTKLARVLMLAPMTAVLVYLLSRSKGRAVATPEQPLVPGFIIALMVFIVVTSLVSLPIQFSDLLSTISKFLMTMALAGLGLGSRFTRIWAKGPRPLLLASFSTLFIVLGGLAIVWLFE